MEFESLPILFTLIVSWVYYRVKRFATVKVQSMFIPARMVSQVLARTSLFQCSAPRCL